MSKNKKTSYVETAKRDTDADGDFDSIDTETFTYDSRGRLLSEESRSESILDGTRRYEIHTYEYDGGKQPVRKTQQQDFDGDGVSDSGATTTYRYNDRGDLRQEVTTSPDWSRDGNPDYRIIIDYTYDDKGRRIEQPVVWNFSDSVITHPGIPI